MAPISAPSKRQRPDSAQSRPLKRKRLSSNTQPRQLKRRREEEDLDALSQRIQDINVHENEYESFAILPLSQPTSRGLEASHFKTLTDIQKRAIPYALKESDVLGAAKTGSGKTLAFLVPVLENLYRKKWTDMDGLGALILSPTRELAIQIFEVLRKIGRYHNFSAGLVIGGKSLQEERERLGRMNILVCTPGRMLQHMDQTTTFEIGNLQLLVLDEADRLMDMGFQSTVDAIVEHLPKERQTLLFSATQTKKVSDLARLSLKDPVYLSVHEAASSATPSTLQQNYIVTPLHEKLDTLWSFLRSNVKSKIIVFLSSGKQTKYVYEALRHLQPGLPLLHLHGRQKQMARLDITNRFSASKNACIFCTDVAARGLDFPAVDWVIQLDCPEDASTYVHRVGRTARFERSGRAVLFLEPSEEEGMLSRLVQSKVIVEKINVRQKKQQSIKNQLQNLCFKDPELKYLGQKAFISYVRSIYVQKNKDVFQISKLPLEEYASSLGLPGAPKIKYLKGNGIRTLKNAPIQVGVSSEDDSDSEVDRVSEPKKIKTAVRTRYDRMFERTNQDVFADHHAKLVDDDVKDSLNTKNDGRGEDEFLSVKRRVSVSSSDEGEHEGLALSEKPTSSKGVISPMNIDSKRKEKLLKSKKKLLKLKGKGEKLVFDEEGNPHQIYELEDEEQFKQRGAPDTQKTQFLELEQRKLQTVDVEDKIAAKAKRKEKRAKRKAFEARMEGPGSDSEGADAVLVPYEDDEGVNENGDDHDDIQDEKVSPEPVKKRPKKWFEDDSGDEKKFKRRKANRDVEEPETLEDLEAVASGLLS